MKDAKTFGDLSLSTISRRGISRQQMLSVCSEGSRRILPIGLELIYSRSEPMLSVLYQNAISEAEDRMQELEDILHETAALSCSPNGAIMLKDLIQTYRAHMNGRGIYDGEEGSLYCRILKLSTMVDEEFCALALRLKSKSKARNCDSAGSRLSVIPHSEGVPYDLWKKCLKQYKAELALNILVDAYSHSRSKRLAFQGLVHAYNSRASMLLQRSSFSLTEPVEDYYYQSTYSSETSLTPDSALQDQQALQPGLPANEVNACQVSGFPSDICAFSSNLVGANQAFPSLEFLNSVAASNPFRTRDDAMMSSGNSGSQLLDAIGAVAGLYTRSEFLSSQLGHLSESKVEAITVREEKLQAYADWFQKKISLKRTQQALTAWRQKYLHGLDLEAQVRESVLRADHLLARTFGAMRLHFLRWQRLLPIAKEFHRAHQAQFIATAFSAWREATRLISPYILLERLYEGSDRQLRDSRRTLPRDLALSSGLQDPRPLETSMSFLSVLGITPQFIEQRQKNRVLQFIRCALWLTAYVPSLRNAHAVLLNVHARSLYTAYLQALKEESDQQGLPGKDPQVRNNAMVVFLQTLFSMKPHLISGMLPITISSLRRNVDYLRAIHAANAYQLFVMEAGFNAFRRHAHTSKLALSKRIKAITFARFRKGVRLFQFDCIALERYNQFLIGRLFDAMRTKVHFSRTMQTIASRLNLNLMRRSFRMMHDVYLFQLVLSRNEEALVTRSNYTLLSTAFRNLHTRYVILYLVRYQNASILRDYYLYRRAFESILQVHDRQMRGEAIYSKSCLSLMRRTLSGILEASSTQRLRYELASGHYTKILVRVRNTVFRQWRWRTADVRDLILIAGEQIATVERDYKARAFQAWRGVFQEFRSCEQYLSQKEGIRVLRTAYRELSWLFGLARTADRHNNIREHQRNIYVAGKIFRSMRQLSAQKAFKRKEIAEELRRRYNGYLLKQAVQTILLAIKGIALTRLVNRCLLQRFFSNLVQQHRELIRERNTEHRVKNGLAHLSAEQIERLKSNVATLLSTFADSEKTFNHQLNAHVSKGDLMSLRGYLLQWKLYAKKSSKLTQQEGAVVSIVTTHVLSLAWRSWRAALALVQKGHDIEVLVDARLLRQAWVCMQALLFHLQYCEVAIEQRTRTRLLRYTLDHLVYSLSLSRRVVSVSRLAYVRSARTVFAALRHRLAALQKLHSLVSVSARRAVLRVYFRHLAEIYHTNQRINLLTRRSNLSCLKRAFAQLVNSHRLRVLEANLTSLTVCRLKRAAFSVWTHKNRRSAQLQRSCDMARISMDSCLTKRAFSVWVTRCKHRLKIAALQEDLCRRLNKHLLRQAYETIVARAEEFLLNEQLVRGLYYLRTMRASMDALVTYAAAKKTQRTEAEAAADVFRRTALLRRCMLSGRRNLANKQTMLAAAVRYEETLKRKELSLIFQHWFDKAQFLAAAERRVLPLSYRWALPVHFWAWLSLARAILHHRRYTKQTYLRHLHRYTDAVNRMKRQMRTNNLLKQKADHLISVQNRKCMFDALRTMMDQYSRRTGECEHWLLT
ncbi:Hypothetical protein DHA2_153715 [Giardia duodenalis]|uniref:Uncharacterized protein n=1 Tax=Giardia intestinalis TaxID=5741 RepID=V6T7R7_GIAIN|nr:Hypothetical protein DHA2_153715 [Giardia intestinalis]